MFNENAPEIAQIFSSNNSSLTADNLIKDLKNEDKKRINGNMEKKGKDE